MKRNSVIAFVFVLLLMSQFSCKSDQSNANAPQQQANVTMPSPNAETAKQNLPGSTAGQTEGNKNDSMIPELVEVYSKIFTARMKGDKDTVAPLLGDDYKGATPEGKAENKSQVLASISPDKKPEMWSLDDLKSTVNGDTGTVTGKVSVTYKDHTETWQINETFKKRDGKWIAVSSQPSNYKKA